MNSENYFGFLKQMETQSVVEQSEKYELERELFSLVEATLRLESELESAVRLRER